MKGQAVALSNVFNWTKMDNIFVLFYLPAFFPQPASFPILIIGKTL
jgi:hypothetical protein